MSMGIDFVKIFVEGDLSPTNFTAQLFHLMAKADHENLARFEKGFPLETELFYWWRGSTNNPTKEDIFQFIKNQRKENAEPATP